ncbi:MAG: NUDIX hydrolase [Actinomycetota bacterium]
MPEVSKDQLPLVQDAAEHWPVTASVQLAQGSLVRLRSDTVRFPDGGTADREVVEHPGAVAVVALNESGEVLLIRQYRHPVGQLLWEIPAGLRDVAGEPAQITAERELLEETGYRATDWQQLLEVFSSPGFSTERITIFLARGLTQVPGHDQQYVREHEEASIVPAWILLEQAVATVLAGELHNGVAAVGILSAYAARDGALAAPPRADGPGR